MNRKPDIIVLIIDALREDHAQPFNNILKDFGFVYYENAISPAPWTVPSHASIFTGLYPFLHNSHEKKKEKEIIKIKLSGNSNTLAEILSKIGYNTFLFSANPYLRPSFGYKGFNYFYEPPCRPHYLLTEEEVQDFQRLKDKYKTSNKVNLAKAFLREGLYFSLIRTTFKVFLGKLIYLITPGVKWPKDKGATHIIKKTKRINFDKKDPNFIFMNFMEVHEPYYVGDIGKKCAFNNLKTGKLNKEIVEQWKHKYKEQVLYIRDKIGDLLLEFNKKLIFNDNSLIILTSDHGQLLGEHGRIDHGTFLYEELMRVPLFIKYPDNLNVKMKDRKNEYICLTKLFSLILSVANGSLENDDILYSDTVFSESFGTDKKLSIDNEKEKSNIEKLEKYRISVYSKGHHGIFNVEDWKWEEIKSENESKVAEEILKGKILNYLNIVTAIKTSDFLG